MLRYKFIIQYDGSYFSGWQFQKNKMTVQGLLEEALKKISKTKERIPVYGAGRTDAGVHAWGQVAHADINLNLNNNDMQNALNGNLPDYCRISKVEKVSKNFHSRYNAKSRFYRYQCYTGNSILFRNQSWMLSGLDVDYLNSLSKHLIGEKNFLSFSKFNNKIKNTNCIIFDCKWSRSGSMITFKIKANRYLHHMIRYLVGTIIAIEQKKYSENEFQLLLERPKKNVKIFKAPAQGLILEKINYV